MSLSISEFVDVTVNVGAVAVGSVSYDSGLLLIAKSDWPVAITERTKEYGSLTEVINAGFGSGIQSAVSAYFAQSPSPSKVVLGRYGDVVGGVAETPAQGLAACRENNSGWYAAAIVGLDDTDANFVNKIEGVAAAVEAFEIPTVFFYQTVNTDCITDNTTNIMTDMKTSNYKRTFGFYTDDTTKLVAIACVGRVCGLNSKEANTAFALAFKSLAAVTSTDISDAQYEVLKKYNGNVYANVARGKYNFIMNGSSASGARYDEIYCLDVLKSEIETNVMNLFAGQLVIPQTDSGVTMIVSKINEACSTVADIGFIAPGIWNGPNVKTLKTGDALPSGYTVMHDSIYEQSQTDRENRIAPTMYVCIKLAGAVEYLAVVVNVNR